jgi:hypothetical protein
MSRVLVYVLSAHQHPYGQMIQNSMETWDRNHDQGVDVKYYCGYPIINTDRIISVPVEESYATIGYKNIAAFERALQWDWDFMARPNASCYVHKEKLWQFCQGLKPTGLVMAVMATPTPHCGVQRPFLWGGCQVIMSRDVVEAIVRNAHLWRHDLIEDVALGELVQDLGFTVDVKLPSCSINKNETDWTLISYFGESKKGSFQDIIKGDNHIFLRCKHDADRSVDADVMRLLHDFL